MGGGDIGDVAEDDFGLETSKGTGLRVSQVAEIVATSRNLDQDTLRESTRDPFKMGVLITREKDGYLQSTLRRNIDQMDIDDVEFNTIYFTSSFIQACIGCDVCPTPGKMEEISDRGKITNASSTKN
jgi:hypothetical protein